MTGFETIVRPVVFPDIRPPPAQTLPPAADPEKGFCTINGNPAKEVNLTTSWSSSTSTSHQVETQRRVDTARVYQMDDDGTINRDNFVDVESANRIKTRGGKKPAVDGSGGGGMIPGPGPYGYSHIDWSDYKRVDPEENIEIKQTDQIKNNPGAVE